jgi:hypothetical protein
MYSINNTLSYINTIEYYNIIYEKIKIVNLKKTRIKMTFLDNYDIVDE